MGSGHLQAIRALPGLGRVVAGVDPSADACGRLREEFGIERTYADLDAALANDEIQAIDVATEPSYHHQVAVPSLQPGNPGHSENRLGWLLRPARP